MLLIGGVTIGMMIFGPLSAVFPLMTYQHFGGDGYAASLAEAAFGVGMLVGSGILIAWGGGKRLAGLIAVAAVIVGVATAVCGFLPPDAFPAFIGLVAVMAVACAWFNGPTMTLTQRNVPDDKMGRAMGLLDVYKRQFGDSASRATVAATSVTPSAPSDRFAPGQGWCYAWDFLRTD